MKKILNLTVAVGLILTLGACSSSKTTETGENTDPQAAPATDAATDAVPQTTAENTAEPAAPADPNAAVPPPAQDPAQAQAQPQPPTPPEQPQTAQAETPATPPSPAGSGNFDNYTVQQGDTLMKVAFETYGDLYRWKGILEANRDKIKDPNHIPAGTVLKVEKPATSVSVERNGEKYLIKTGDTLGTISNDVYGTKSKWKKLWENNKQMIHDPNRIFAGFYLYYQPDGSVPKTDSPSVTPAPMAETKAVAPPAVTTTPAADTSRAPASAAPAITPPAAPAAVAPPAAVPGTVTAQ
jgi:nucleoid-associated protein YgaU